MPDQQPDDTSGKRSVVSANDLLVWLQELIDAKPQDAGVSLEWSVPAYFLGDMNVVASLSLLATA